MARVSLWVAVLLLLSGVALADSRTRAREAYLSASRHYDLQEFREALADFKEAYRSVPDPSLLFNIAQCHRQLGENDEAIRFFRTYLNKLPHAANRDEVTTIVERLERERREAEAAPKPPATPPPTPPATSPAPAATTPTPPPPAAPASPPPASPEASPAPTSPEASPQASPPPSAATTLVSTPPPEHRPVYKKWWLWTTVGVVVAAGVGIGLGIGLTQSHTPSATTDYGTVKPSWQ